MTEENLIKRFRKIVNLIPDKESSIKYAEDPSTLLKELDQLKNEKETIMDQLRSCEDKTMTIKKMGNVKSMIIGLFNKFSRQDYPYKFSRDQSMVLHAYILIKIAEDISYALDYNLEGPSEYYLEIDSDFNCDEIVRILKDSLNFLDNQKISDYVKLYDFVRSVQKQIVNLDKDCGRLTI
jgi:hypothetical protein